MAMLYITMNKLFFISTLFVVCHGDDINLRGAGASFPSSVYRSWIKSFQNYRQVFVQLNMSYEAVGSGTGKSWFKDESVPLQYAGSDSLLSMEDYIQHPDLQMFPTMAGAVVVAFNLPGISSLNITREIIVGIYNGTYTHWNDPTIQAVNPGSILPSQPITVIARADKSGTTEIFTKALSSFDGKWSQKYGAFSKGLDDDYKPYHWDAAAVDQYGNTNRGVSCLLLSILYSVGYLSLADAEEDHIPYADVMNTDGSLVMADSDAIQSAMDDFAGSFDEKLTADIVNGPSGSSYPIAGYTYMVIRKSTMISCQSAVELWNYIEWLLYDRVARSSCEENFFVPLSKQVTTQIEGAILEKLSCSGDSVKTAALKKQQAEKEQLQTWRLILEVVGPIIAVVLIIIVIYVSYQQFKINKGLLKEEWKIRFKSLKLSSVSQSIHRSVFTVSKGSTQTSLMAQSAENIAVYNGDDKVYLNRINLPSKNLSLRTRRSLLWMKEALDHINITKFFGLVEFGGNMSTVSRLCSKGNLYDILQGDKYDLDINFKFSMACDIVEGMCYLSKHGIIHGNLSSHTCYIDERWNVKVGDWQVGQIAELEKDNQISILSSDDDEESDKNITARQKFWTAPELLNNSHLFATKEADVYSFGILLLEIFIRDDPYHTLDSKEPFVILSMIKDMGLRPEIPEEFPKNLNSILYQAWSEEPKQRPTFLSIRKTLINSKPSKKSVLDCMMEAQENYVHQLEDKVNERTKELEIAIKQSNDLLNKMLPQSVAKALARGESVIPEFYDSVTIFFSDIVGFTDLSSSSSPMEVVVMLNDLYTVFDDVLDRHEVYKVETIGDAYMVISGAPLRNGMLHARHIASMALDLYEASKSFVIRHRPGKRLEYRAGIHSGLCCTGVVGTTMPRYCLFGDTVNTASRMESTSESLKIQLSNATKCILDDLGGFAVEDRGYIPVKGKGEMKTYWLVGRKPLATSNDDNNIICLPRVTVSSISNEITQVDIT